MPCKKTLLRVSTLYQNDFSPHRPKSLTSEYGKFANSEPRHKALANSHIRAYGQFHVCTRSIDVLNRSGVRDPLHPRWRLPGRNRLLRAGLLGRQRGLRPSGLRQPVPHRQHGVGSVGPRFPLRQRTRFGGDRVERRPRGGHPARRHPGLQRRERIGRAGRRRRGLSAAVHPAHVPARRGAGDEHRSGPG